MSYCRFSDGDVYLYASVDGDWECCMCWLTGDLVVSLKTLEEVKEHLEAHVAAGHNVPSYALERVNQELEEQEAKP